MVLWIIALLSVMVVVLARETQLESQIRKTSGEQLRRQWTCRAGVEKALAILHDDERNSDGLGDIWHDNADLCQNIRLDGNILDIVITDEAGKLNINTATKNQLMQLRDMTESIAEAILDWRDEDSDPQPHGVEDGYYLNLEPRYRIRNGPFGSVGELLQVRGVTRELLYGEDVNMNGRLDENEDDGDLTPPRDDGNGKLYLGWLPLLTCCSYAHNRDAQSAQRINIKQADENELMEKLSLSNAHAQWIIKKRETELQSIGDLIDDNSPKEPPQKQGEDDQNEAAPIDLQTFGGIVDRITVNERDEIPGLVNINTAGRDVLLAVLEGNETTVDDIISRRKSSATPMESIGELLHLGAVDVKTFKQIANYLTTRSDVYQVTCTVCSEINDAVSRCEFIVDRSGTAGTILYQHQGVRH